MIEVDAKTFRLMVSGSSVYSTGGGLEALAQLRMFHPQGSRPVRLMSPWEFGKDDFVCAAFGVGSAAGGEFDPFEPLRRAMRKLEECTKRKYSAIFAGETNIEALVFSAAQALGLPVLDADCTGGRAVPEIKFDNLLAHGRSILPSVAFVDDGRHIVIEECENPDEMDRRIRKLAVSSRSKSAAVVDHPISIATARQTLTMGVLSRSYKTGIFIKKAAQYRDPIGAMSRHVDGRLLIDGRVSGVNLKDDKRRGFLVGSYSVTSEDGRVAKVLVKNESMVCWINGKLTAHAPDLIMTIDRNSLNGVHNSKIEVGDDVFMLSKRAEGIWNTKRGREIFDYRQFL